VIPRILYDTSVLLSGIGWRGKPATTLDLARNRHVVGLTCDHIIREIGEKLETKLGYAPTAVDEKLAELLVFLQRIEVTGTLHVVTNDADDDPIIECAVVGRAQYIVTGDKRHLLPMGSFQGIEIITPSRLLELVAP
jgi:putative PIN family toxin of toxin-antitoxin system